MVIFILQYQVSVAVIKMKRIACLFQRDKNVASYELVYLICSDESGISEAAKFADKKFIRSKGKKIGRIISMREEEYNRA